MRTMDMEDLYRALRAGHVQAQGIVDTVPDPLLVLDGGQCVLNVNRSFCETFQVERDDVIGYCLFDLGNGQWNIPQLRSLLVDVIPNATTVIDFRVEHDFPAIGRRTMLLSARKLRHADRPSHSLLLSIVDATDRTRHDSEQALLFGELRHRVKNLLGIVRAMARLTATDGRSAEQYRQDFLGRFDALMAAQDIAFDPASTSSLHDLCTRILAPYAARGDAMAIAPGPAVELSHVHTQSLALVLHELATNAAKYGALAGAHGRIAIGWTVAHGVLVLTWQESGGPPVAPPAAAGFGTRLIRTMLAHNGDGDVTLDYAADGLRARISLPLGGG